MIPETNVNWKAFEFKYADNPQKAFESLTYYLFCGEFGKKYGIFRYFNQPHIETMPITSGDRIIGFQSKYYSDSVNMSGKESELTSALEGAARTYQGITTLYFYISRDFPPSSKKDAVKPAYLERIESKANNLGIEIVWRTRGNIEAQLMQEGRFAACRNLYFQVDSAVQTCCEGLKNCKTRLLNDISTSLAYQGQTITLMHNRFDLTEFIGSEDQVLIIDGGAGMGKSALFKQTFTLLHPETVLLAFKCTDLDVPDIRHFLSIYGNLTLEEVLEIYNEADTRILYIDSAERYFTIKYQQTAEDILNVFLSAGWKLVFTIRTTYCEPFRDYMLQSVRVQQHQVRPIDRGVLSELSRTYGFILPKDDKLLELLCTPFYLGLYFRIEDLDKQEMLSLNIETFERTVWNEIIRQNKTRRDDMPARREAALKKITMAMLRGEAYLYTIQNDDDYSALKALEQGGILSQTEDANSYYYNHDVFEELAANHIFTDRYEDHPDGEAFFAPFRPSLRTRKLFRGWLIRFTANQENQNIVFCFLSRDDIARIWKDEVLLGVISSESLKDVFSQIVSNSGAMLKKTALMLDTCCRVANYSGLGKSSGSLLPFRFSTPSGYAWKAFLDYISQNKCSLSWDIDLCSAVIQALDSWTKQIQYAHDENTRTAGEIACFLYEKTYSDSEPRYLGSSLREKLQDIMLNAAWMIQDQLKRIFQPVLEDTGDQEDENSPTYSAFGPRHSRPDAPAFCLDLAESAVSDALHFGQFPLAMPEITIKLMEKLWHGSDNAPVFHNIDMDAYFGLRHFVSNQYGPVSSYKTPIMPLLNTNMKAATDFLIAFVSDAGNAYMHSHLNIDYNECKSIILHIAGVQVKQAASDRLWKMYRGTHVGPDLLVSLLMGFEKWLLGMAKKSEPGKLVKYCQYILLRSTNVMLTAVIVSAAEAYPNKLFDLICELLKTPEVFHFDTVRFTAEKTSSFLLFGTNIFEKEHLESNKLPHRNVRLENVILNYQADASKRSNQSFRQHINKLYQALDEVTDDIESWPTEDKYAYYRMDLRRYDKVTDARTDDNGHITYVVEPDYTDDMRALSEQTARDSEAIMKYFDLLLWSEGAFQGDGQGKQYDSKFSNLAATCQIFREVSDCLDDLLEHPDTANQQSELYIHRYIACLSFTGAVLFRDHRNELPPEDLDICVDTILGLGYLFTHAPELERIQAGNGLEAVAAGLALMIAEDDEDPENEYDPLRLLLELLLLDRGDQNRIHNQIATNAWANSMRVGWQVVHLFSFLADRYEDMVESHVSTTIDDFWGSYLDAIKSILGKTTAELTSIPVSKLRKTTVFSTIALISPISEQAVMIAEITKDIAMSTAFSKDADRSDDYRFLIRHILNYVNWLTDTLLCCSHDERVMLVDSFVATADLATNDNVIFLMKNLILQQETLGKEDAFWELWELLEQHVLDAFNGTKQRHYSDLAFPTGVDELVSTYLFARTKWRDGVYSCSLLSAKRAAFIQDFVTRSEHMKPILFALSHLLNTVGRDTYQDNGIDWLYDLVQEDPECSETLYNNTLYYMEEYIGRFVTRHHSCFRTDVKLANKVQTVLDYMVAQHSPIAFFIREQL